MLKVKLSKEVMINGKKTKEVGLNVESLTGADFIQAERQARAMGDNSPQAFLSSQFHAIIASKLIGVPVEELESWPINDFARVAANVQNFLFNAG